jgi:adenine-specific DNA-methyltransferase
MRRVGVPGDRPEERGTKMSDEPTRVNVKTPDLAAAKRAVFEELFPGVIADGVLDAARLGELFDIEVTAPADGRERYGLMWAGKQEAIRTLQTPSRATLIPEVDKSINFEDGRNVFIEGDNLEVLKLLQKSYNDSFNLIYIDPPYNTGNDFVYADDFSDTLRTYLSYTGQIDDGGRRLSSDVDTAGRKHSRWLSMLYPRLVLARNLLDSDGLIFVSIDDNEVAQLRLVLDEIFGSENFIATFIWEKRQNRENRKEVSYRHDTIICYARAATESRALRQLPMSERALASYQNPDGDPRGQWKSDPATGQAGPGRRAAQFYTVTAPNGKTHTLPSGRCWIYTQDVMDEAIADGRIWFGADGNGVPRKKTYLEAKVRGLVPETILFAADVGTNESAKNDLKRLFGGTAVFDTPKPVRLLQTLLRIGSDPDALVLDFFAGSGTIGEAALRLNAEDGGTRRVVQVQLPEVLPSDSQARELGFDTVSDVARARWGRLAEELSSKTDTSLCSYALARSNFRSDHGSDPATELFRLEASTLLPATPNDEAVAAEILLKEGVRLEAPRARVLVADSAAIVAESVAVVLNGEITERVISEAFDLGAGVVVFLEDAFAGSDALKATASAQAKNLGIRMKTF